MNFKQFETKLRKERPKFIIFLKKHRVLGKYLKYRKLYLIEKGKTFPFVYEFPGEGFEIFHGFNWKKTSEGRNFWRKLSNKYRVSLGFLN